MPVPLRVRGVTVVSRSRLIFRIIKAMLESFQAKVEVLSRKSFISVHVHGGVNKKVVFI